MGGPVVEVAPRFSVVLGEGVVEGRTAGPGGGEAVARLQPLLVESVEVVERALQDAQLVHPAVLYRGRRQPAELCLGRGQQVTAVGANGLECCGGVGVALACAQPVGVVVVRPAVEVGVFVGVGVPGVEDLLAVAQVAVEVVEGLGVCVVIGGDGEGSCRGQRRVAGRVLAAVVFAGFGCGGRRAARACARMTFSRLV